MEAIHRTPEVHTLAEAAGILRVRKSWLERRAAAREVPFTMLGGAYHFTAEHLGEIVRLNEQRPAPAESKPVGHRKPVRKATAGVTTLRPRPRPEGPRRKRPAA